MIIKSNEEHYQLSPSRKLLFMTFKSKEGQEVTIELTTRAADMLNEFASLFNELEKTEKYITLK
jgi:hypothetical protein